MSTRTYVDRKRSDLRDPVVSGILAQAAPAATTWEAVYQVPREQRAKVTVTVANRSGSADAFRLAVSPKGAALANAHYLAYDHPIEANDSLSVDQLELGASDVVRVYSTGGNVSFSIHGLEEDR